MKQYKKIPVLLLVVLLLGCATQEDTPTNKRTTNEESNDNRIVTPINSKTEDTQKERDKDKVNNITVVEDTSANQKTNIKSGKKILDVPLIKQNPELKYGCEVTSLTMVLKYAGVKVDKMNLANELDKDMDPVVKDKNGNILKWGNPDHGFVGDMTGKHLGYAVFDKPIENLMKKYMKGQTLNLTGKPFEQILSQIDKDKPVLVWTTGDYKLPDRWETWEHKGKTIKTPLDLHAVVLVGYDKENVYLNDPLSGKKNVKVNKKQFIESWKALKERAISYN
jgi:uncharacterized protein YvpB